MTAQNDRNAAAADRMIKRRNTLALLAGQADAIAGPHPKDSYSDTVTCYRCGATNKTLVGGATWRWTGEHWEHRCSGLDPQVGHWEIEAPPDADDDRLCDECEATESDPYRVEDA